MPHFFRLALLSLLTLWLSGCNPFAGKQEVVRQTFYVFGTAVHIEIVNTPKDKAMSAINAIEVDFNHFNREWHAWEKGGLLSKVNDAIAQHQSIVVPASVKAFIVKSQRLSKESDYLFDPGIGNLLKLWGFESEDWHGPPPSQQAINHWLKTRPSIADIRFDGNKLSSTNSEVKLDFGGNAKGLALDRAINTLKSEGIENAIVNIGGDMRIIGTKDGHAWKIGVQDPKAPSNVIGMVKLSGDESIVTSGSYERFFKWKGKTYSHILDPNTGYPAEHFLSVTVIDKDATTADSASTALMVAGPKRWQKVAKQMGITKAYLVDDKGHEIITDAMKPYLTLLPSHKTP
ncbi:FAD:protein FMN transferase [Hydrogenovibrio kuenenii]|uniref:FAD:protein FMN transferase n=1 Tax=Hydrogenovibrio kuenenii TaxID=63658 RepID=UPI00046794D6|nr:FAD:protein FMN transferase [Hydrogenovibrio kuenenii]